MVRYSSNFFVFIFLCYVSLYLHAQNKNQPNLFDAQYRVINSEKYPMMTSDMKGFESDCDRSVFIDLINISLYRGIGYGGYEQKLSQKQSITGLLGICYWPDILSWSFNNTDDFYVHDKSNVNNGIHLNTWRWTDKRPNIPGPVLGAEFHWGLNEDIFHGFNVKIGYMFHNFTQNMSQILDTSSFGFYQNPLQNNRAIRVDQQVLHLGLGYKKMTRQNVFFDGGITFGIRLISYNIKLSPFNDVYNIKKSSVYSYTSDKFIPLNEIFVPDDSGKKPFQFVPTFMMQGRVGFGFGKKKTRFSKS
jgi:hypothetical protein